MIEYPSKKEIYEIRLKLLEIASNISKKGITPEGLTRKAKEIEKELKEWQQ